MKEIKPEIQEEKKPNLSIIIPFAGEYPQALFTIQAVAQSLLKTEIDFEILAVDNFCVELIDQWNTANQKAANVIQNKIHASNRGNNYDRVLVEDIQDGYAMLPKCHQSNKAGEAIEAAAAGNPWLRYLTYDERLSHWECKRLACQEAKADTFLFLDAHVIPSMGIDQMYFAYQYFRKKGSFHMPLTYKILEWHKLIYKLVIENDFWGYSFTGYTPSAENEPLEVPCMSTCGMMISREIYDTIGGWPKYMTAYGGGENFMNFALTACGFKKWIFPPVTLHHHGEKRDYHYTFDGIVWNRMVSHYLFGGEKILDKMLKNQKGKPKVLQHYRDIIVDTPDYQGHREIIKKNTTTDLDQWRKKWEKIQNGE